MKRTVKFGIVFSVLLIASCLTSNEDPVKIESNSTQSKIDTVFLKDTIFKTDTFLIIDTIALLDTIHHIIKNTDTESIFGVWKHKSKSTDLLITLSITKPSADDAFVWENVASFTYTQTFYGQEAGNGRIASYKDGLAKVSFDGKTSDWYMAVNDNQMILEIIGDSPFIRSNNDEPRVFTRR